MRLQLDVGKIMSCAGSSKNTCTVRVNVLLFCVIELTVYGAGQWRLTRGNELQRLTVYQWHSLPFPFNAMLISVLGSLLFNDCRVGQEQLSKSNLDCFHLYIRPG